MLLRPASKPNRDVRRFASMLRWSQALLALLALNAAVATSCSTLDTEGFSGGTPPDSATTDGTPDPVGDGSGGIVDANGADAAPTLPACGASGRCVPDAPPGWQGPVALQTTIGGGPDASSATCPGAFPVVVHDGFGEPSTEAAQCGCECKGGCGGSVSNYVSSCGSLRCGGGGSIMTSCVQLTCSQAVDSAKAHLEPEFNCLPAPNKNVPSTFGRSFRACGMTTPPARESCAESERCIGVPEPPFGSSFCIVATGLFTCPAGPYSVRTISYEKATDTRTCTPCTCSKTDGGCSGRLNVYSDGACGALQTTVDFDTCFTSPPGGSVKFATTSTATCVASPVNPSGSLTPLNPTTICCTP